METDRLLIVVNLSTEKLDVCSASLSKDLSTFSIGGELSSYLLTAEESDLSRTACSYLEEKLKEKTPGPVVCSNIDLLFHPSFKLDPLALFRQINRITKLIILWPGDFKEGVLSYAQPEHHHYRFWRNLEGIEIKGVNDALQ